MRLTKGLEESVSQLIDSLNTVDELNHLKDFVMENEDDLKKEFIRRIDEKITSLELAKENDKY